MNVRTLAVNVLTLVSLARASIQSLCYIASKFVTFGLTLVYCDGAPLYALGLKRNGGILMDVWLFACSTGMIVSSCSIVLPMRDSHGFFFTIALRKSWRSSVMNV